MSDGLSHYLCGLIFTSNFLNPLRNFIHREQTPFLVLRLAWHATKVLILKPFPVLHKLTTITVLLPLDPKFIKINKQLRTCFLLFGYDLFLRLPKI